MNNHFSLLYNLKIRLNFKKNGVVKKLWLVRFLKNVKNACYKDTNIALKCTTSNVCK